MTYLLEFTLQGLTKMSNELLRGGWRAKHGHAAKWKRAVWIKAWPHKPPQPLERASVTITRCSSMQPDFDGLVSAGKPLLDGLVECGIIADDKQAVIGVPSYLWERTSPGKGKVRVRVEAT